MSVVGLVLASTSPRRRALLEQAGIPFAAIDPGVADEREESLARSLLATGLAPAAVARRLAVAKAVAAAAKAPAGSRAVLAGDTVVALEREVLGKPRDARDAREMLERLAGKTHEVHTGVALLALAQGRLVAHVETSRVTFRAVERPAIDAYVDTGAWKGKAGGYGAQDDAAKPLLEKVEGSFSNVVGLPVESLRALAARAGLEALVDPGTPGRARSRRLAGGGAGAALALALLPGCPGAPPAAAPPTPAPSATTTTPAEVDSSEPFEPLPDDDVPRPAEGLPQTGCRELSIVVAGRKVQVEVADTVARRRLGLMWRDRLDDERGMLFVYPEPGERSFWMQNTRIPLTIAYVRDDGTISSLEDMEPLDETLHPSKEPVRLALEMNKGWFKVHGIGPGAKISGVESVRARDR